MSTQTLSSVAIDVVDQYSLAGKHLVRAYRATTERAVGAVNERFASVVNTRSLPLVNDQAKARLINAHQQVTGVVSFGLDLPAKGADITIDQVARRVNVGIERVSATTARVGNVFGASALNKAGSLALPLANVSLNVATAVAEGSKRLSDRVAGEVVVAAPAKKAAKKVAAKKRATRTTTRRA